jgi:5-enolpyruvylshikimate-3-phosphate synthase
MALAVAGLAAEEPVTVGNAGVVDESFPDFVFALRSLGAQVGIEAENRET